LRNQHEWVNEKSILKKARGSHILDCGCGIGRWGYLLKKKGIDGVVGVDIYRPLYDPSKKI